MQRALPIALVAAVLAGCGEGARDAGEPLVVATTSHAADLARAVAGDRAEVRGLLSPSSDPHEYEPRPSDARAVAQAALVVRSGGDLDSWLSDLTAGADAETLTLLDEVERRGEDPHWWQDPRNAARAVEAIRDALIRADPEGAPAYRANARGYLGRIARLDDAIAACMAAVPPARRRLVTTHDALGYFAARYGIEVVGAVIPSLSSQARPSAGEVDELVTEIEAQEVAAIFPESAIDPRLERAIARESGAEVGDALWADTLGPPGSGGATYLEAMASNADALIRGFTGGERGCPGASSR